MGWRGTMRSVGAAIRAAERDAERRHKIAFKQAVAAHGAEAVAEWEDHLDSLVRVHANLTEAIDWRAMAARPRPATPPPSSAHADAARTALEKFKPGFFDFFRGGSVKIRAGLEERLAGASEWDRQEDVRNKADFDRALQEWETDTALARGLIAGELSAIRTVLEEMQSVMTKEGLIGSRVEFTMKENFVHARPQVHDLGIVPDFRRKQLASGKLSETKMPEAQRNELYQDYVSSVALKVAGDLFQLLPLDEVYVTCEASMVNQQTGHKAATPILSVHFVRSTFAGLNLSSLDPSDAMRNFRHAMTFKRTTGFSAVEYLAQF